MMTKKVAACMLRCRMAVFPRRAFWSRRLLRVQVAPRLVPEMVVLQQCANTVRRDDAQVAPRLAPEMMALQQCANMVHRDDKSAGGASASFRHWCASTLGFLTASLAAAGFRQQICCEERTGGERLVMSADCGGTTTRLRLYRVSPTLPILERQEAPGTLIVDEKFPNIMFKSLEDVASAFLGAHCHPTSGLPLPRVAVFAVAGVVTANQCRFTNLDWLVDGNAMAKHLGIDRVELINDFVAQGYGALTLADEDALRLNNVEPRRGAPMACMGAGTGLGQCYLVSDPDGGYRCYPSEGGHAEFPPRGEGSDELQIELLKYLKVKFSGWNRISIERVVSGKGICNIYEFLAYRTPSRVDKAVHKELLNKQGDASVIAKNAVPKSLCKEALHIFAECYGAQAGSFAIQLLPFGGLFITGGVSNKLSGMLTDPSGAFMTAYHDKGRCSPLLDQVPLFLVKSEDMGQRGAHLRSVQLLKEEEAGQAPRVCEQVPLSGDCLVAPRESIYDGGSTGVDGSLLVQLVSDFQARNRRQKIEKGTELDHEPVFKTMLWRVQRGGHKKKKEDWIYREMWITRNGSLAYRSKERQQDFVYFTPHDLDKATITELTQDDSSMSWSFCIKTQGFEPALFAASSEAERVLWIQKLLECRTLQTKQNELTPPPRL